MAVFVLPLSCTLEHRHVILAGSRCEQPTNQRSRLGDDLAFSPAQLSSSPQPVTMCVLSVSCVLLLERCFGCFGF